MYFANETVTANLYPAANVVDVVEQEMTKKGNIGKKVMLVAAAAAIALTTGIGAAKICTDCLSECLAYADPIEEAAEADAPVGLLAETLKGTSTEA